MAETSDETSLMTRLIAHHAEQAAELAVANAELERIQAGRASDELTTDAAFNFQQGKVNGMSFCVDSLAAFFLSHRAFARGEVEPDSFIDEN